MIADTSSPKRLPADRRAKLLELAIFRIQRGRAHTKASVVNFATVAKEAGVTTSLIHNHYPGIAAKIRSLSGLEASARAEKLRVKLAEADQSNKGLRADLAAAEKRIAQLASINEVLLNENMMLKNQSNTKVVLLPRRK